MSNPQAQHLHIGWLANCDIPSAVRQIPVTYLSDRYVLVSVVDSTPQVGNLPSLVPLIQSHGAFYGLCGEDVVIEAPFLLVLIEEHGFFNGFDELWFMSHIPAMAKPTALRITSDLRFEIDPPAGLSVWMQEAECLLGLGDGDGLNFATFDPGAADCFRRFE
jgi:hypothetical protein